MEPSVVILIAALTASTLAALATAAVVSVSSTRSERERLRADERGRRELCRLLKSLTDAVVTPRASQVERIEAEQAGPWLEEVRSGSPRASWEPRERDNGSGVPSPDVVASMPRGNKD